jgi:hypothetical protein
MELYVEMKNGRMTRNEALEIITQAKMHPPKVQPSKCHLEHIEAPAGAQYAEYQ